MSLSNAQQALTACKTELQEYFNDVVAIEPLDCDSLDLRAEYFKWTRRKTKLLRTEKDFVLPHKIIPNKITERDYNYLRSDKQAIVDKYYKKDDTAGVYVINAKKTALSQHEAETLIHSLAIKRGKVVWVNFGFNIGHEFRGKHPAIILKNTKSVLIVIPLSSQSPSKPDINVEVKNVHGLPYRPRWVNILRIVPISILRVDFNSPIGDVKGDVLSEISAKIASHGIK